MRGQKRHDQYSIYKTMWQSLHRYFPTPLAQPRSPAGALWSADTYHHRIWNKLTKTFGKTANTGKSAYCYNTLPDINHHLTVFESRYMHNKYLPCTGWKSQAKWWWTDMQTDRWRDKSVVFQILREGKYGGRYSKGTFKVLFWKKCTCSNGTYKD